jgi:hypothetical protein
MKKAGEVYMDEKNAYKTEARRVLAETKKRCPKNATRINVDKKTTMEFFVNEKAIKFVEDYLTHFGGCKAMRDVNYFRTYFITTKPAAVITPRTFGRFSVSIDKGNFNLDTLDCVKKFLQK